MIEDRPFPVGERVCHAVDPTKKEGKVTRIVGNNRIVEWNGKGSELVPSGMLITLRRGRKRV